MRRGFSLTDSLVLAAVAGVLAAFASGCSNTAYLTRGEKLYTGAYVHVEEKEGIPDKSVLENQLDLLAKPKPNGKILGLFRLKLWLYNIGFFKESLGEPPVLLQSVEPDRVAARMRALLESKGYFQTDVHHTVREQEKTADIQYGIAVHSPYRINGIAVKSDSTTLIDAIRSTMGETILTAGDQYDLVKLKQERERIDAALKEKGYFYFSPDFIVFQADSTAGKRTVDLSLQVKRDIPIEATRTYTIGNTYIESGYSLNRDSVTTPAGDTVSIGSCYYLDLDKKFDPDVIVRSVFFRKGVPYSRNNHDLTLNRLMNLGVFKFVNIRFVEADSAGIPRLEPHIYLTPLPTKTVRIELRGVSQSNNLAGPVFESSFRNRNLFGGAELFTLSFETGLEIPVGGGPSGGNSFEIGTRAELDLPKFVTPFRLENVSSLFVPKTRIVLGLSLLQRLLYYQLLSVDGSFGYNWKESINTEHNLSPLSITFAHLTNRTQKFDDLLSTNPFLRKSFEEQFIIGQNYSFTYNDQLEKDHKNHLYFKGSIDLSGNLLQLVQSLFIKHKATPDTPYEIFGTTYSEYYKFDIDVRKYYNSSDQTASFASRLIVGIGVPYGNSATMPYVKQFYIGGSNSVRAFVAGGLGPGSYRIPDSVAAKSFIDQAGDIKLEANCEYRFPIVSILRGALFVDAGNIWLLQEDPSRPGSQFSGKTFFDEVAVGTGFGLRLDLSFFILRFDLAFPLRIPSMPSGERWVMSKIDFGNPSWRKNNLVLNVGIGYPY
ncbi:MAG: BamA/TamA family outer membrane protein [Ignavibacteriales bacterium]|nr:BamA/TamA family outer membrane protein [Ignavibacteriales bacterium]